MHGGRGAREDKGVQGYARDARVIKGMQGRKGREGNARDPGEETSSESHVLDRKEVRAAQGKGVQGGCTGVQRKATEGAKWESGRPVFALPAFKGMPAHAGTLLWLPAHGLQNTHHNWERPDDFIPERWLTPGTEYADKLPMPADFYEGWYDVTAARGECVEDAVDPGALPPPPPCTLSH